MSAGPRLVIRRRMTFLKLSRKVSSLYLPLTALLFACQSPTDPTGPDADNQPPGVETPPSFETRPSLEWIVGLATPPDMLSPTVLPQAMARQTSAARMLASARARTRITGPFMLGASTPSIATGINASGQISGYEENLGEGISAAWRFDKTGLVMLPTATPEGSALATDLNDAGVVVGYTVEPDEATGTWRAFPTRWEADGTRTRLPDVATGAWAVARAINRRGIVVGFSGSQAIRWDARGARILPGINAVAHDLNNRGTVVGSANRLPVTWSRSGVLTPLRLPSGATEGSALGINEAGRVVGQAIYKGATGNFVRSSAVVWSTRGVPKVLPGVGFASAVAINDAGVIVGRSDFAPAVWVGGQPVAIPLGDSEDSELPPDGQLTDLNSKQIVGQANPDGHDNHGEAARWSFKRSR